MKLSELIENLICLEGLEKEKKRENGAPTSKAFKDYTVYIALKNYELYNKDGSIGIYRFNEPNPKASVLRDRYRLVDFGFIDDLEAPKESVKVGEVHTLELRTDGKSTKIKDITIEKSLGWTLTKEDPLIPLAPPTEATPTEATPHDVVNNPSHYKRGEIECYEALKASMTKEQFLGHLKATAIAYLWRYDLKNGLEDVKKAKWYVDKMVEEMESK